MLKFLSVFALATLELWAAVPLGLALKLTPLLTAVATASGAVAGMIVVIALGGRVRDWMLKKKNAAESKGEAREQRLIVRIWDRYGVIGLGLLGPFLAGAPLSAALGVMFGARSSRLVFWLALGILLWTSVLTAAGAVGDESLAALWDRYF